MTTTFDPEIDYRVTLKDYDGDQYTVTVRAIGPKGAEGTALQTARDRGHDVSGVLAVVEA